jgi:PrtD family type I secretion system ABC transporter
LRATLASPSVTAVIDAPWVPAFIVIIALMHPLLGLIALAAAVVLFAVALVNEWASRSALGRAGRFSIAATQSVESVLRNAEVIQALGMLPALLERYNETNAQALDAQRQAGDRGAALIGLSKSLRLLAQILILGSGAWLVLQGQLTSGGMIAASILLGRALAPVEQSIGGWRQLVGARDAWGRLTRLLSEVPPPARGTALPPPRGTALPPPRGTALPPPRGELACQQVTFVPAGQENPILANVTFDLAAGEVLGIIGPSAAGKSSLCKVFTGAWNPTRGHARLDGADITSWNAAELGVHLGYLPQDVELFAGTVSENIARLARRPDAAAVVAAARDAGVHDVILSLPKGYDTEVGEAGTLLSGGERQRVGLARASFGSPALILLDEPNASLDSAGEEALAGAIAAAKARGATVLLVTHQPSILLAVDRLIVLREGRIQALGPRDQVLDKLRQPPAPAQLPAGGGS